MGKMKQKKQQQHTIIIEEIAGNKKTKTFHPKKSKLNNVKRHQTNEKLAEFSVAIVHNEYSH